MSEINPDDLEIIKDILGDDDDDPIFGNRKNQTNKSKSMLSNNDNNQKNQNPITTDQYISTKKSDHTISINSKTANNNSNPIIGLQSGPVQKCTSVCLGGTKIPVGMMTETSEPHTCSNLYCIKCDFNVRRFPDRRWKKSTDYLFLRNNFPENVQQNLVISPGWCAYCCQCTFCEEQSFRKLPAFSSNWVCKGHR